MAKKKKTREKDVAVPLEPLKPMVEIDGVQVEIPEHVIQANMPPAPRFRVKIRSPEHHVNQLIFCRSPLKRKIVRAGRRGGKTTGAAILAVEAFVKGKRVLYAAPTIDQVKKFWKEVCRSLEEPIAYSQLYKNETEHIIEQRGSERRIRAKTAFNAETLRGDYADLLILDEWQLMDETAWTEVGAPMLIDNNGDVVFIYTPPSLESRSASKARDPQHAAKMFKEHKDDPLWLCIHFPSSDNPYISREGLEEVSKNMSAMAFRQEILAEDTDEIPGALWTRKIIEDSRVKSMPCVARRIVIAIDPSGGNTTEVGIMAGAEGEDGEFYVLEDGSMVASRPKEWATKSVNMYYRHMADRIIGERNYGGDMIEETLRNVDENVSYKDVNASRGKLVRAEPVLALFQNKKMHLVGQFPELEDEMCSYTAQPGQKSPNRMDAMVWCGIELSGAGSLGLLDFYKSGRAQAFMGRKPVAMTPIMGARDVAAVATNDQTPKCPSCKDAMIGLIAGGQMRCRACGHQWWKDGPPVIQKLGGRRMLEIEKG